VSGSEKPPAPEACGAGPVHPGLESATLTASIGSLSESLDALRATCTVLERKCTGLNWALEQANRRLRQSLEERERLASRLDSILRCLSVGVVAVDLEGRLIEFNPAAERITGYTRSDVLGTPYGEWVGRGADGRLGLLHTMEAGVAAENEERQIASAAGERVPVGFSTSLVKGEGGEILGAVEVFTDLRKTKRMEEELLRARTLAAMGEMAAEVARQIRNPLAGIAGFAELLARDLESDPSLGKLVRKIQDGVSGVEGAVARLVENARPFPGQFDTLDVVPLIEKTLDLFECSFEGGTRVRLVRRMCPCQALARVNDEQFRQALWALLVNAREAIQGAGTVTVTLEIEDRPVRPSDDGRAQPGPGGKGNGPGASVVLAVQDDGEGMPPEVRDRAFSPFFSTKERRVGVGLTTVRRIITGHGGEVGVETEPGRGTTVTLRIPATTEARPESGRRESL